METNELQMLIETFKDYRDLITPIEQNLKTFSVSFEGIKEDIKSINAGLDGNLQDKLNKIYKELSSHADKAKTLAGEVDKFLASTAKYVSAVDGLANVCGRIEGKLNVVDNLQHKAEEQIEKLDSIIE